MIALPEVRFFGTAVQAKVPVSERSLSGVVETVLYFA